MGDISSIIDPDVWPPQVVAGDGFSFVLAGGSVYGCGLFKDDQGGINGFCGNNPGLQVGWI